MYNIGGVNGVEGTQDVVQDGHDVLIVDLDVLTIFKKFPKITLYVFHYNEHMVQF